MRNGMDQATGEGGGRGSQEAWLDAAYDLLLESGVDGVRIQPLAQKMHLTRTSFYWIFKDRDALLHLLLARWRDKNTGGIIKQASAYADTLVEAILNVSDCWFDVTLFDSKLEFAVRSWAMQSPEILSEVHSADEQRLQALKDMFQRFGENDMSASVRANTIYLMQIGYISRQIDEDLETRISRMPEYIKVFTGKAPHRRELNRFFSRHGLPHLGSQRGAHV